jgi:hypothetical protein
MEAPGSVFVGDRLAMCPERPLLRPAATPRAARALRAGLGRATALPSAEVARH